MTNSEFLDVYRSYKGDKSKQHILLYNILQDVDRAMFLSKFGANRALYYMDDYEKVLLKKHVATLPFEVVKRRIEQLGKGQIIVGQPLKTGEVVELRINGRSIFKAIVK